MNSKRPYLLRAFHEWICDNSCTPFVVVDSTAEGVMLPDALQGDKQVVLNVGLNAVRNLQITDDGVMFDARFSGISHEVFVPLEAVQAIYARENGEGMAFEQVESPVEPKDVDGDDEPPPTGPSSPGKPTLSIVR